MTITHHNLLPPEFRRRMLFTMRLRQWFRVWGLSLVALLAGGYYKSLEYRGIEQSWEILRQRTIPIQQMKRANTALTEQLADLEEKVLLIDHVNDAEHHLALIGVISQSVRQSGNTIQIQSCTLQEIAPAGGGGNSRQQPTRSQQAKQPVRSAAQHMKIELRGMSVDERAIARFIKTLKTVDIFTSVELKSVRNTLVSDQTLRAYHIECAL